jgi:hypothetical protein
MKNRVTSYLTKVSHNQIKGIAERKKLGNERTVLDRSMTELKKIYWYEKELLIVIPMLVSNACSIELVNSLNVLLKYSHERVQRLEEIFPNINKLETSQRPYDNVPYKSIIWPPSQYDFRLIFWLVNNK